MKIETAKRSIPNINRAIEGTLESMEEIKRNDEENSEEMVEHMIACHISYLESLRKNLAEAEATLSSGKDGKHWSL